MSQFDAIDPILSMWGASHSLVWLTEYQDTEVRYFIMNPNSSDGPQIWDRVQIWVDPPRDDRTMVHVFQSKFGRRKKKEEQFACPISKLSGTLDKALKVAETWLSSTKAR